MGASPDRTFFRGSKVHAHDLVMTTLATSLPGFIFNSSSLLYKPVVPMHAASGEVAILSNITDEETLRAVIMGEKLL